MLFSQFVGILADVVAARDQLTLLDVVKSEQLVVAVAPVVHTKVDAGLVRRGAHHQVHHQLGHIDSFLELPMRVVLLTAVYIATTAISSLPVPLSLRVTVVFLVATTRIFHHRIVVAISDITDCCFTVLYLVEVLGDPILTAVLTPCLP